jgi:hypothetical protein
LTLSAAKKEAATAAPSRAGNGRAFAAPALAGPRFYRPLPPADRMTEAEHRQMRESGWPAELGCCLIFALTMALIPRTASANDLFGWCVVNDVLGGRSFFSAVFGGENFTDFVFPFEEHVRVEYGRTGQTYCHTWNSELDARTWKDKEMADQGELGEKTTDTNWTP